MQHMMQHMIQHMQHMQHMMQHKMQHMMQHMQYMMTAVELNQLSLYSLAGLVMPSKEELISTKGYDC